MSARKVGKLQERLERLQASPRSDQDADSWVGRIVRMLSRDERLALERAFASRDKERNADEKVWIEQLPPDQQAVVRRVHSLLQEFGVEAT
jgi:hypothetical protein